MSNSIITVSETFYKELKEHMQNGEEVSVKRIYSIFPNINPKTISWRLYELVQKGKIHRAGHGYYALTKIEEHNPAGYNYLQKKSKIVFDTLTMIINV